MRQVSPQRQDELAHTLAKLWRVIWLAAQTGDRELRVRALHLAVLVDRRLTQYGEVT